MSPTTPEVPNQTSPFVKLIERLTDGRTGRKYRITNPDDRQLIPVDEIKASRLADEQDRREGAMAHFLIYYLDGQEIGRLCEITGPYASPPSFSFGDKGSESGDDQQIAKSIATIEYLEAEGRLIAID